MCGISVFLASAVKKGSKASNKSSIWKSVFFTPNQINFKKIFKRSILSKFLRKYPYLYFSRRKNGVYFLVLSLRKVITISTVICMHLLKFRQLFFAMTTSQAEVWRIDQFSKSSSFTWSWKYFLLLVPV